MPGSLVIVSGASSGIGLAMARSVPWPRSRVIDISRRGAPGLEHLAADLADPEQWARVASFFAREIEGFAGERVVFVHAAGTLEPIGFAGEVDAAAYRRAVLLGAACPQVLGDAFLRAARTTRAECRLRADHLGRRAPRLPGLVGVRRGQGGGRPMGAHGRGRAGAPRRARARAGGGAGDRGHGDAGADPRHAGRAISRRSRASSSSSRPASCASRARWPPRSGRCSSASFRTARWSISAISKPRLPCPAPRADRNAWASSRHLPVPPRSTASSARASTAR